MRKRQVGIEPLFAEAKAWHGRYRFRLRGLPKFNAEALPIAVGQNRKRLLSQRGWSRPFPSGAPDRVLPPLPGVLAVVSGGTRPPFTSHAPPRSPTPSPFSTGCPPVSPGRKRSYVLCGE
jgi:hypothetical protein